MLFDLKILRSIYVIQYHPEDIFIKFTCHALLYIVFSYWLLITWISRGAFLVFVLFSAHLCSPCRVLCCSARASEPDGWRSPRPAHSRWPPRSTPARPSPPRRSGRCCQATRAWRAGQGLGPAAPQTEASPGEEEEGFIPFHRSIQTKKQLQYRELFIWHYIQFCSTSLKLFLVCRLFLRLYLASYCSFTLTLTLNWFYYL